MNTLVELSVGFDPYPHQLASQFLLLSVGKFDQFLTPSPLCFNKIESPHSTMNVSSLLLQTSQLRAH